MGWFILGFFVGFIGCAFSVLLCAKDNEVVDLGDGYAIKLEFIKKN